MTDRGYVPHSSTNHTPCSLVNTTDRFFFLTASQNTKAGQEAANLSLDSSGPDSNHTRPSSVSASAAQHPEAAFLEEAFHSNLAPRLYINTVARRELAHCTHLKTRGSRLAAERSLLRLVAHTTPCVCSGPPAARPPNTENAPGVGNSSSCVVYADARTVTKNCWLIKNVSNSFLISGQTVRQEDSNGVCIFLNRTDTNQAAMCVEYR